MAIHRRRVLTGAAATALTSFAPTVAALADLASFRSADLMQASFRLRRRPRALDYAYCDPWLVRVAHGMPEYLIHEVSGATFGRGASGELEAKGAWSGYAPPYLRIALIEGEDGKPRLQGISSDRSSGDFAEADARDLESLLFAARLVGALCDSEARRQGDGFLKLSPASTRYGDLNIFLVPASGYGAPAGCSFPQQLRAREASIGQG
jgi:hypothetical protein